MSLISEAWNTFASLASNDAWTIKDAFNTNGSWIAGGITLIAGAVVFLFIYRVVPILDRNLERWVSVWAYLILAAIIFVEVVLRFYSNFITWWGGQRVQYSIDFASTIPPLWFLIMAWFGCAYNARLRTHLSFSEFRNAMPRTMQMVSLTLDFLLWWGFCLIAIVTTARLTVNSASNFALVQATDNTMLWWFYITVPIAFILLAARALQNWLEDLRAYRTGEPLIKQAVIGGDV